MGNPLTSGLLARTVRRLFAILAVAALLLPVFGSATDHHFPERQYSHAHIYFGPTVVDHVHPYEEVHVHSQAKEATGGTIGVSPLGDSTPHEIVYLTSADGLGQQSAAPFVPAAQAAAIFPDPESFFFAIAQREHILSGAFIARPKNPPPT